jgi:hypothetical protein
LENSTASDPLGKLSGNSDHQVGSLLLSMGDRGEEVEIKVNRDETKKISFFYFIQEERMGRLTGTSASPFLSRIK